MAEIQFEGEQEFVRPSAAAQESRGLTALVMRWGLAKDEKTAQYVLLGVIGISVFIIFIAWWFAGSPSNAVSLPPTPLP